METSSQLEFQSTDPLFTRDEMFEKMENVIKYQKFFYRRISNWEKITPSSLHINLRNITRLYYLYHSVDKYSIQSFKMIARMTVMDKNIYICVQGKMGLIDENYIQFCHIEGFEYKFPGRGDIFYCTNPAIFMALVLEGSGLTLRQKDSIFSFLYSDGINIIDNYRNYIKLYTNSINTKTAKSPQNLFDLCKNYYHDNLRLYNKLGKLTIPKIQIENIGNAGDKFAASAAIYNVDR